MRNRRRSEAPTAVTAVFGPSGNLKKAGDAAGLGCLFPIVTTAAGAAIAVIAFLNSQRNGKFGNLVMPLIAVGLIGLVAGAWLELGVLSQLEIRIAQSRRLARLSMVPLGPGLPR